MNKINLKDILLESNMKTYGVNTDYGNRDYAITCINGNILKGDCHKDSLEAYLEEPDEYLDYTQGYVTEEEQESINQKMFFASVITSKNYIDKYIILYPSSIFIYSMEDVISILNDNFPNHIICIDDNNRMEEYYKNPYILKIS